MGGRPCPEPLRGCPFDYPYADDHHEYWPASEYTTPTEKKFRQLEGNIVRGMCRCLHNLEHLKKPPKKPMLETMREALEAERNARNNG
jgi:hypothetical protein